MNSTLQQAVSLAWTLATSGQIPETIIGVWLILCPVLLTGIGCWMLLDARRERKHMARLRAKRAAYRSHWNKGLR